MVVERIAVPLRRSGSSAGRVARWALSLSALLVCLAGLESSAGEQPLDDLLQPGVEEDVCERSRKFLEEIEAEHGEKSLELGNALDRVIVALIADTAPFCDRAWLQRMGERAVTIRRDRSEQDPPLKLARSLSALGQIAHMREDYARAEALQLEALDRARSAAGPRHAELFSIWLRLSNARKRLTRYEEARAALDRAREVADAAYGPSDRRVGTVELSLAMLARKQDDVDRAERHAIRAAEILDESPGAEVRVARTLGALAWVARERGEYGLARERLQRALQLELGVYGEGHPEVASRRVALGNVAWYEGDLPRARAYWESALASFEAMGLRGTLEAVPSMSNVALAARTLGDLAAAEAMHRETLTVCLDKLGEDHPETAKTRVDLGRLSHQRGQYREALAQLEKGLAVFLELYGEEHTGTAIALEGAGRALMELGRHESAREHLERARAIHETVRGEKHFHTLRVRQALGELHAHAGEWEASQRAHTGMLALVEETLAPAHPVAIAARSGLARAHAAQGEAQAAVRSATRAAADLHRHLRPIVGVLPEGQALHTLRTRDRPEEILFSILLEEGRSGSARAAAIEGVWRWALRWRGMVQEELASRALAVRAGGSEGARRAWDRLQAARERLAELWVRGAGSEPGAYARALAEAEDERRAAAEALAAESAGYRALRGNRAVGFGELLEALGDRDGLVQIVRVEVRAPSTGAGSLRDVALLVAPGGAADAVDLGEAARNDRLVDAWTRELDGALPLARPDSEALEPLWRAGRSLRRAVWDPILARLGDAEEVHLVPGGPLALVPVASLPLDEGGFVLDEGPSVRIVDSARDLVSPLYPVGEPGRGLLALGAPDFEAGPEARRSGLEGAARVASVFRSARSACRGIAERAWDPLPAAEAEVSLVASLLEGEQPSWAVTGAGASEERFKRLAPGRRVLHLATHGYFVGDDACDERIGPLLRSGLILAGAGRGDDATAAPAESTEDGVLTAEEVAALDLTGVELVVLSACEAGRGDVVDGEGVLGLRRALSLAGAQQMVVNVWPVPDTWSARWMKAFYGAMREGEDVATAVRVAQRDNLDRLRRVGRTPHPYYWSGWIAVGSPAGSGTNRASNSGAVSPDASRICTR